MTFPRPQRRWPAIICAAIILGSFLILPAPGETRAATLPPGFQDQTVFSGLTEPTAVSFASDGRVFVAEKSGLVKVFDSLTDPTATTFADLRTNTYNFWDRGMLGLALAPNFPVDPWVYVLYTYDGMIGGPAPLWGTAGQTSDPCPNPPGATGDGCIVSGRLSRLQANGNVMIGSEQVLIEDWCQQYPSHSIGSVYFGPDGALYVSGGDGASFNFTDWGQDGSPVNPCGDPPGGVGGSMTPPTAEGGALRSQDLRTMPVGGPASYPTVVASASPVAYWRLGETSGTLADDAVGSNNGTYAGGVTINQPPLILGSSDRSASFDGSNDQVTVPSSSALNPTAQVSVVAWIRPDVWGTGNRRIVQKHTADTQWLLRTTNSGTKLEFRVAGLGAAGTTSLPSVGQTHMIVGTYNGSAVRLYIDGVQVASVAASGPVPTSTGALAIGNKPGSVAAGDHFDGTIDEVSVHNVGLSGTQVTQLWQSGTQVGSTADPVTLDGAVLRVNPATGAGLPDNPLAASPDPNARRMIAHGLRNPFRITNRPGTGEIWIGDVGAGTWEELDRIQNPTGGVVNFGWPCYEGAPINGGYDSANLNICENLYAQPGAVTSPHYTYRHDLKPVNNTCPNGSSSVSGVAFYDGGNYPATYDGALFFSDYSRDCIWVMFEGTNGLPNPANIQSFVTGASNPVQLTIGPGGDLFYVDLAGAIHRIKFTSSNQPPTAVATADPESGPVPLTVQFDGSGSSDPDPGDSLTYAWDLDGDGSYDDSTQVSPVWTYTQSATVVARLRVTDESGAFDTDSVTISADNTPPVPVIDTPPAGTLWSVGDLISFTGHATDAQQGTLPASALSWQLELHHCPSNCHIHPLQSWTGVAGGSFSAPDHEYPSHLELILTATDAGNASASTTLVLDPQTVNLTMASAPAGLQLSLNGVSQATPFVKTVIVGSTNSLTAPTPQTLGGNVYEFASWSDGGAASHTITAPATNASYTATYNLTGTGTVYFQDGFESGNMSAWTASTNVAVQTAERFAGTYGAQAQTDGSVTAYATKNLASGQTVLYLETRVKVISQGASTTAYLWRLRTGTGALIAGIYRNVDGKLRLKNDTGFAGANSGTVLTPGTWHLLRWRIVINGASGQSEVSLDGVQVPELSGTFNFGTNSIGRLQMADNNNGRPYNIAFDDVRAADHFSGS